MRKRRYKKRLKSNRSLACALTVFRSPLIERFPVELVTPFLDSGVAGVDLILARALGETIRRTGGVPSGASGSPVYEGDRLVGAISTTFYPDASLVGITPIDAMLEVANEPHTGDLASFPITDGDIQANKAKPTAVGFASTRALREIAERLGQPTVSTTEGTAARVATQTPTPGSPIGAALLIGDIRLGFIGTATAIAGKQLLAFGHPLLFSGPTNMPLTLATVLDTARGDFPSKIGDFGSVIGTVLQDRAAGIYAELGKQPDLVDLNLVVRDEDRSSLETVKAQAVPIPMQLPFLVFISALESMQRAMNRVGPGTARWRWSIRVAGVEDPIRVTESSYDGFDIGYAVAISAVPLIERLLEEGTKIEAVSLLTEVTARKTKTE